MEEDYSIRKSAISGKGALNDTLTGTDNDTCQLS